MIYSALTHFDASRPRVYAVVLRRPALHGSPNAETAGAADVCQDCPRIESPWKRSLGDEIRAEPVKISDGSKIKELKENTSDSNSIILFSPSDIELS